MYEKWAGYWPYGQKKTLLSCIKKIGILDGFDYAIYQLTTWNGVILDKLLFTQSNSPIIWYPKVHYRVRKNPPLVPILREMNPIHTPSLFP
jgi:hypothetical protein